MAVVEGKLLGTEACSLGQGQTAGTNCVSNERRASLQSVTGVRKEGMPAVVYCNIKRGQVQYPLHFGV